MQEAQLMKVLIVPGNSERQNALRAVEKGSFDIFPKPVEVDELRVTDLHREWPGSGLFGRNLCL